jgi:hypothetical protein
MFFENRVIKQDQLQVRHNEKFPNSGWQGAQIQVIERPVTVHVSLMGGLTM